MSIFHSASSSRRTAARLIESSRNSSRYELNTHIGRLLKPKYEPVMLWEGGADLEDTYDFSAKGNLWCNDVCLVVGPLGRYFQVVSRIGIGYIVYDNIEFI